jgi:hypothetical protein
MKITITRSGGFAGISKSFSADDNALNETDSKKMKELIQNSNFFEMPSKSSVPQRGGAADLIVYRITVEEDGKSHTIERTESTIDPSLKSLVKLLESKQVG